MIKLILVLTFSIYFIKMLFSKIIIQGSIIKDLQNHNKAIDLSKIEKYIELCHNAQEKLLNLERQNLQKEFQLQKFNFILKQSKNDSFNQFLEIK